MRFALWVSCTSDLCSVSCGVRTPCARCALHWHVAQHGRIFPPSKRGDASVVLDWHTGVRSAALTAHVWESARRWLCL